MNDELAAVLREARPYRRSLMLASGLMVLQSASALVLPWLGGQLIGTLVPSGRGPLLSIDAVFASMAGLLAFQACLAVTHGYVLARTGDRLTADLRVRVYNHTQSLPLAFHHERSKGDLLTLLTQDVGILSAFISGTLVTLLPSVLTFAGALAMMLWIDWRLGAVAGLTVPLFFLLLQFVGRVIRPLSDELSAAHAHAFTLAEENLGLLPIIKAFTREGEISALYQRAVRRIRDLSTRQALARLGLGPAVELIATLGMLALIWIATRDVLSGRLAPAALVTFLMYGLLLTRPMSALASVYGETHHVRAVTARLLDVLQTASESGGTERSLPPVRGAVTFENVSFRYPGREPTFENLNLTISPGEIIALTGPNGAGKSTLVSLLMRFVIPERGRILIDGIDVSTVSLRSLREQIGLVPQYMLLQSGTVRDNIAAGRPDALPPAIETAARAACAHDFIAGLPAGYDTVVGEKGVRLSGGQQQRIALARALLKNAPILILDEATAMYDLEGQEEFQAFLKHRLRDRTVIIIAHGTASLKLADRIVRLEAGFPCTV